MTCIDTATEYQPTKYNTPILIHTIAGGKIYKELGAELKTTTIDEDLPIGPEESFEKLLLEQPKWISDLTKFVTFAPDESKYSKMDTTINNILKAHDKDGYLIAVSVGSI